jgi:hypothetical protein
MKKFSPPKMKEVSFPTPHTPHPTPSFKSGDYFYLFFPHPTPHTLFQVRRQETGDYFYLYFPHPTPYTLHPTPHTPLHHSIEYNRVFSKSDRLLALISPSVRVIDQRKEPLRAAIS